jgi:hypothetical protein
MRQAIWALRELALRSSRCWTEQPSAAGAEAAGRACAEPGRARWAASEALRQAAKVARRLGAMRRLDGPLEKRGLALARAKLANWKGPTLARICSEAVNGPPIGLAACRFSPADGKDVATLARASAIS